MNERIKQLVEQVFFDENTNQPSDKMYTFTEHKMQQFAELIVRECQRQVEEQYLPIMEDIELMKDTHWDAYVQCGVDSYVAIREHFFGVDGA
jgi:hypothetical protein